MIISQWFKELTSQLRKPGFSALNSPTTWFLITLDVNVMRSVHRPFWLLQNLGLIWGWQQLWKNMSREINPSIHRHLFGLGHKDSRLTRNALVSLPRSASPALLLTNWKGNLTGRLWRGSPKENSPKDTWISTKYNRNFELKKQTNDY